MPKNISVFEPQEINGQTVEPLCVPHNEMDTLSSSVAAATNLLWFAFHITLANKNALEARRIMRMLQVVVEDEVDKEFLQDMEDAVAVLDAYIKKSHGDLNKETKKRKPKRNR